MSTRTTDCLDLVERLPEGAQLRLQNVGWDEYEHLLSQMDALPGRRTAGQTAALKAFREHSRARPR